MMRGWFPWRQWIKFNAWRDRRHNLPQPDMNALGHTERFIVTAVNQTVHDLEQEYAGRAAPIKARLQKTQKELEEICAPEYERLQQKTGRREVLRAIGPVTHMLLLGLLTLGELAFNLVAFNVFREPQLYTLLMALAVAVSIPVSAFALGRWIREWPRPAWATGLKIIIVSSAVIAFLVGINRVRMSYLEELTPQLSGILAKLGPAFFLVNLIVLVGAVLVSYWATDPEPGFERAKNRVDKARHSTSKLQGALSALRCSLRARVAQCHEAGRQAIALYRQVNSRGRREVPRYFVDDREKHHYLEFDQAAEDWGFEETSRVPRKEEAWIA